MVTLEEYRELAEQHGMCEEYKALWDGCLSRKQVFDMALGIKATDFLCDSIAKGWGISPDHIADRFSHFLNGRCVVNKNGYSSQMYCKYKGIATANTTLLCLIESDVTIKWDGFYPICEIYCVGKCRVDIRCKGEFVFVCYGEPSDVVITGDTSRVKRINKKERERNDG